MKETISGIVAAVAIIGICRLLEKYFTLKLLAAHILVAIAFIYVGFSLKNNPVSTIFQEVVIALIFYFMAIAGYSRNNILIAYGIILHGVWDIFHHNNLLLKTDLPAYWPSFCFVIDIIDGLYFLFVFRYKKEKQVNHGLTGLTISEPESAILLNADLVKDVESFIKN